MSIKNFLFIIVFCIFASSAFADQLLCTISSDIDSSYATLSYDLDPDTKEITHLYQSAFENGKLTSREEVKVDNLSKGGIILLQKDKIVVVRIYSDNFDRDQGGMLHLDTLYSGVTGERREYEFDVVKQGEGLALYRNKAPFTKMKFIAKRSKLLGIIGVEKILFQ